MKLIIGLGNPGDKYKKTRHNAGFLFLDKLQKVYQLSDFTFNKKFFADITEGLNSTNEKLILAKPQTFMNNSGKSVLALMDFYKINIEQIIVVADDLDIEIGNYKISQNIKAAGHNGMQNIIDTIGTQNFTRIRIGIEKEGGRINRGQISGEKFVLQNFDDNEIKILQEVFEKIIQEPIL